MHENKYEPLNLDVDVINEYDKEMKKYYENRPVRAPFTVKTVKGWSDHIQDHLERSILPNMLNHLNKQGYAKK